MTIPYRYIAFVIMRLFSKYCIQGNIFPRFIFATFSLLVFRQFLKDWAICIGSNYFFLNITLSGRIQDGAKLFASEEGRMKHGTKITLYTVYKHDTMYIQTFSRLVLKWHKYHPVNKIGLYKAHLHISNSHLSINTQSHKF